MKKELRLASQRYRLLKWHEDAGEDVTIRTFVDQESALAFLRKLAVNPSNLGVLRAVVAEHRSLQTTRGEGGKQVLDEVASQLACGHLKLAELPQQEVYSDAGAAPAAEAPAPVEEAPQRRAWIRLRVVEHVSGAPVSEAKLEVTLPDESKRDCQTDGAGEVYISDIDPGTCAVTSPVKGARRKDTFAYVEQGHRPGDSKQQQGSPGAQQSGAKKAEKKGPFRLAMINRCELAPDQTLDELAAAHSLSRDDLTLFNWNTTDQETVESMLNPAASQTTEAATSEPTAPDGEPKSVASIPNTAPPVRPRVLVPQRWQASLETGHTHTIRVRSPQRKAYVSLVLLDERMATVVPGKRYQIEDKTGAVLYEGQTDGDGFLEHGPVPMGYYTLTVLDLPTWDLDALKEKKKDADEGEEAVAASAAPAGEGEKKERKGDDKTPAEAPSIVLDDSFEEPGELPEAVPVEREQPDRGSVTLVVPAVWEERRRYRQRLPLVLPDLQAASMGSPLTSQGAA